MMLPPAIYHRPQNIKDLKLLVTFEDEPSPTFFAKACTELDCLVELSEFVLTILHMLGYINIMRFIPLCILGHV